MNKANRKKILPHLFFCKRMAFTFMFLFALTLLTACGGGGGGAGETSSVNTGIFIDGPVHGLEYQTATRNGITDSQGIFKCEPGEEITFSIGDVVLGTTLCKSIITPLDLVPDAVDETDPTVTNILCFLQSLDDDGDIDDAILITPQIASEVSGRPINFNTSVEDFDNEEIADLLDALNDQEAFSGDTPRVLISAEEAREHFRLAREEQLDPDELTALFTLSPETPIVFEPATFDASESTGNITEYVWDFGDGQTGSGAEVSHIYSATGTYLVTLTVNGGKNAEANSSLEIVVNVPPNEPPTASFTPYPTTGIAPQLVSFVPAATDPDGTISQYFWNFGDGLTIKGRTANHTYHEPGTYLATLTVTDDDGAETVVSEEVVITGPSANQKPTASFTATPETGEATLQVSFNASGSSDPDGSIASYNWDFGDGQTSTGATRNHSYSEAGSYLAKLTVTDNKGSTASTTREITVLELVVDTGCSSNPCDDHATCDDSGAEIICSCNSGWTGDGFSCTIVECEDNQTLAYGGTACGLNDRGEFGQRCVNGAWQDNTDVCSDPDVCIDGSFTDGSSGCGLNGNGTLLQECEAGQWTDSDDCADPDVCTNDDTQKGPTPCSGGHYMQLCEDGQWSDTTDCALDDVDEDNDLVDAGEDPNDADNTVCGDSDSDGCDDCSVAGEFDPANDGWDENGDGACELPLDYACMNGANASTDPYRLEACIMFTYVNQDRALFAAESGNAAPLAWNEDIWEVAVAHSVDMCENVFFSHYHPVSGDGPGERLAAAGLYFGWSENIAINLDPGAAQYAFMEEPTCVGHRANVLRPLTIEMGIGYHICDNPDNIDWNGFHFVTQDFRVESIELSAYCQNSANVCQPPPDPLTTAPCPGNLGPNICPAQPEIDYPRFGCPTP